MPYWSQTDLEGVIGQQNVLNIYQDGGTGIVSPVYLAEVQALSDGEVDGMLATEYPGLALPVVQVFQPWTGSTGYQVGQMVVPTAPGAYAFRCVGAAGVSGITQPTWPTKYGANVTDGTVTWVCVSLVPQLVRMASLMWGRCLSYERHADYVRRYGDKPRLQAEAYLTKLQTARRYFADLQSNQQPANVGGASVDNAHRIYVDSPGQPGGSNAGDF